ncbi:MAG: hypothetical protein K8T20_14075 [Planctomycetes bacterium]|nr:hypothetical protein [Planctomycetota bacterium]
MDINVRFGHAPRRRRRRRASVATAIAAIVLAGLAVAGKIFKDARRVTSPPIRETHPR